MSTNQSPPSYPVCIYPPVNKIVDKDWNLSDVNEPMICKLQFQFDKDIDDINLKYDRMVNKELLKKDKEIKDINDKYNHILQKMSNRKQFEIDNYKQYRSSQLKNVLHSKLPTSTNVGWYEYLYSLII